MVKIKFAALAAVILAVMAAVASAQQATQAGVGAAIPDGKVAVINTQVFPGTISELKVKYEQIDNQFKDRYQKLQTVETQLKTMENDLRTKQNVLSADKYQELQVSYDDLKKRGQRDYEDLKAEYDRTLDNATKPIRDKLYQFLQTYASQRGITVMINLAGAAQSGVLAYWNPGTDVTEDFVAEYNKANPVAGGSTSTPRPQPAAPAPAKKP
ncbi:MAG TPA: OmpH family outer membrane protein [Blastocatellia bacterium]|jgi:outer membrane protein